MKHHLLSFAVLALSLGACSQVPFLSSDPDTGAEEVEVSAPSGPRPEARPEGVQLPQSGPDPEVDDTPVAPSLPAGVLGTTVASLGDAAQGGVWLETPLVNSKRQGQVQAANGKKLDVELRPIAGPAGSGSRISLSAMLALGLSLTDLPVLTVHGDG